MDSCMTPCHGVSLRLLAAILNPPILSLDKMPPKTDLPPCIFHAIVGYYTKPSLQSSRSNLVIYHFEQVISIVLSGVMHSCSIHQKQN
jgi:hypothetical protein